MNEYRSLDEGEVTRLAEDALLGAFGVPVRLSQIERISREDRRNLVLRAKAHFGRDVRAVIIKATRLASYCATSATAFIDSGLVTEWTAREVLKQADANVHSPLLAGDARNGIIVFDDLGAQLPSLVKSLLEGTALQAEADLAAYAFAMARLHVATVGCLQDHQKALASAFPHATAPGLLAADWLEQPLPELAGQSLPSEELDAIRRRLANPGPWLALVHADGCPDNVLLDAGKARLIDFEFSAPGHMLLDAVYWRVGFPSCWCAGMVPDEVANRIERVYRDEVVKALPVAAHEQAFVLEMTTVIVARTVFSLHWMLNDALAVDSVWGTATRRSRILWYLQVAINACERAGAFPKLSATLVIWLSHLHQEWPASESLPNYPAFRNFTT